MIEPVCVAEIFGENFKLKKSNPLIRGLKLKVSKGSAHERTRRTPAVSENPEHCTTVEGDIENVISFLERLRSHPSSNLVNEIFVTEILYYNGQCNQAYDHRLMGRFAALGLPLGITCELDESIQIVFENAVFPSTKVLAARLVKKPDAQDP
ncbi:MAG TPA: hypothetical protein DIS79_11375 [Bacteroidetes bacterium]|nr:hypothetical protein [Bacteroidota bacterium]HRK05965.1 hypothetical protein [Chlorobiota bacterium]